MKGILLMILVGLNLGACSPNSDPGNTASVATPADGFQEDPLAIAAFGGNFFAQNESFAAYSFIAGRVSVIDPKQEQQIWSRKVGSLFKASFAVPGVAAVGLVQEKEFRLAGQKEELAWSIPIDLRHWRWARNARVAVFNDDSGLSANVIRNRSDGTWVRQTIEYPKALQDERPAVLIANDGLTVVELFPKAATYVVYRARSVDDDLKEELNCHLGREVIDQDVDAKRIYAGSINNDFLMLGYFNQVAVLPIGENAACVNESDLHLQTVVEEGQIRRILSLNNNQALVASESGEVVVAAIGADAAVSVAEKIGKLCDLPVGLNTLSSRLLAVTCVTDFDDQERVLEVMILIWDLSTKKALFQQILSVEKLAGVAVDPVGKKVFEFLDGGLGEFRITELATGKKRHVRGLFTRGILDSL